MENSIIFKHPIDLLTTPTDGRLYIKGVDKWEETNYQLFKSELKAPSEDVGNIGDYYAFYGRRFNNILYSEDFEQPIWNKIESRVGLEPSLKFPSDASSKLCALETLSVHTLNYVLTNQVGQDLVFSMYVKPNELNNIQIKITDKLNNESVCCKYFLEKDYEKVESTVNGAVLKNKTLEQTVITNIDKSKFYYYRVWFIARFEKAFYLDLDITLLDNDGNEKFIPDNDTEGLFINSIQASFTNGLLSYRPEFPYEGKTEILYEDGELIGYPDNYLKSTNFFPSSLFLKGLYKKLSNTTWRLSSNSLIYFNTNEPDHTKGVENDVATLTSIIRIQPGLLVGTSSNIPKLGRPIGVIRYSKLHNKWYIQYDRNKEYSLEYSNPKPDVKRAAMAISLNQQTYQTASRYCYPHQAHYKGLSNAGGCYNDWSRIHIKR